MRVIVQGNGLPARVDPVLTVFFVPFGNAGGLVHIFDDLSPADSGVIGAEGNLAQLGRIRNDAHLGSPEVVVE